MEPDNMSLVALSPADLPTAQSAIIEWCDRKITAVQTALADLRTNLDIAKRNKWRHSGLLNAVNREEKRVIFYNKIKDALSAGYLIIPNFPVDSFAVRVDPEKARRKTSGYVLDGLTDVEPHLSLSSGEGEYVDDKRSYSDERITIQKDGKTVKEGVFSVRKYNVDIDFPFEMVKPQVLGAVEKAMALKIFDRLGLVRERKRDPIIVGQIQDPRPTGYGDPKVVTFFVAWWLNTEDL